MPMIPQKLIRLVLSVVTSYVFDHKKPFSGKTFAMQVYDNLDEIILCEFVNNQRLQK